VRHLDGLRWHDIHIPSFMKFDTGVDAAMLELLMGWIYDVRR
jgi:hypothetical protein